MHFKVSFPDDKSTALFVRGHLFARNRQCREVHVTQHFVSRYVVRDDWPFVLFENAEWSHSNLLSWPQDKIFYGKNIQLVVVTPRKKPSLPNTRGIDSFFARKELFWFCFFVKKRLRMRFPHISSWFRNQKAKNRANKKNKGGGEGIIIAAFGKNHCNYSHAFFPLNFCSFPKQMERRTKGEIQSKAKISRNCSSFWRKRRGGGAVVWQKLRGWLNK